MTAIKEGTLTKPITKDAAFARLRCSGVSLSETLNMTDNQLLRLPFVGRRTLRFVRGFQPIET